ncbi:hypothetical protein PIB30_023722 [Stylosanthes scabra]|uniref:Uncharacterized protein n=1 Tax=Stylosanthes scabra TaxID=79078 RepID=A0ABU6VCL2_9FABA|nr:hypothetical protein [Stylosanthes scabra]
MEEDNSYENISQEILRIIWDELDFTIESIFAENPESQAFLEKDRTAKQWFFHKQPLIPGNNIAEGRQVIEHWSTGIAKGHNGRTSGIKRLKDLQA